MMVVALGKLEIIYINSLRLSVTGFWGVDGGEDSAQSMVPPQPHQTKRVGTPTTKRQILDIFG